MALNLFAKKLSKKPIGTHVELTVETGSALEKVAGVITDSDFTTSVEVTTFDGDERLLDYSLIKAVEATLLLPCFLLVVICLGSGWLLWERCVQKRYVVIEGTCTDIERSSLHKRIKAIYIRQGEKTVKIAGMGAIKNLCVGDTVTVYVADTTDVYEVDGYLVVCSYLAIVRGGTGDESRRDICQA